MSSSETTVYVVSEQLFHFLDFTLSAKIPTESPKFRLSSFVRFPTFHRRYACYAAKSSRLRVSFSCLENLKFHYKRSSRASITSISFHFVMVVHRNRTVAAGFSPQFNSHAAWQSFFRWLLEKLRYQSISRKPSTNNKIISTKDPDWQIEIDFQLRFVKSYQNTLDLVLLVSTNYFNFFFTTFCYFC